MFWEELLFAEVIVQEALAVLSKPAEWKGHKSKWSAEDSENGKV